MNDIAYSLIVKKRLPIISVNGMVLYLKDLKYDLMSEVFKSSYGIFRKEYSCDHDR